MASVYPSAQWSSVRRGTIPGFAASDIVQGAAVCLASSGDWAFQMIASSNAKPVGIARDYAIAGNPVDVEDFGNIVRLNPGGQGAGGSFNRQSFVGIIGTSTMVHPQSGVTVTYGLYGAVSGTGSAVGGGSVDTVYAVGVAYESAAVGDITALRIEPTILSGVVLP